MVRLGVTASLYPSGQLELQRPLSGEAHDEEGKAVLGHVHGTELSACAVEIVTELKIELSEAWTAFEIVNRPEDVRMALPKEVGHVPAIGEHLAVSDGHDGVGGGLPPVQLPPPPFRNALSSPRPGRTKFPGRILPWRLAEGVGACSPGNMVPAKRQKIGGRGGNRHHPIIEMAARIFVQKQASSISHRIPIPAPVATDERLYAASIEIPLRNPQRPSMAPTVAGRMNVLAGYSPNQETDGVDREKTGPRL